MMSPTPISAVIEMFYPKGFAHDYEWTSRAMGMKHFAIQNDTYVLQFLFFFNVSFCLYIYIYRLTTPVTDCRSFFLFA